MSMDPSIRSDTMRASREKVGRPSPVIPTPNPDPALIRPLPPQVEQVRGNTPDAFWEAAGSLDDLPEIEAAQAQAALAGVDGRAEVMAREAVMNTLNDLNATQPISMQQREDLGESLYPDAVRAAREMLGDQ